MKRSLVGHAGFTLVELTMVLVILGLLLGGVLWGQELIMNGRSKAVIVDLNGLVDAVESYRDRYNSIPGDDPLAQSRWGWAAVPAAVPSSPGNGSVDGAYNEGAAVPEPESRLFWWHLRQAGFIAGATDVAHPALSAQQPTNPFVGMTGVTTGVGAASLGLRGLIVCTANVPGKVASSVDLKLDDGKSSAGGVRAQRQTVSNESIGPAAADYIEDGGVYLLCRRLS